MKAFQPRLPVSTLIHGTSIFQQRCNETTFRNDNLGCVAKMKQSLKKSANVC